MEPSVQYLRDFRDDVLLQSRFREVFEGLFDIYYHVGPAVSHAMGRHSALKYAIRYGLIWPLVRVLKVGGQIRSLSFKNLFGRRP